MSTEQASTAQPNETRNDQDRFKLGDPAGPGNSFARQVAELRATLVNCICPEAMKATILSMVQRAMDGDVAAAKVVLEFVVGKPQPAPEPDRMDAHEWALYQETEPMKKESADVLAAGLPGDNIQVARVMRPIASAVMMQKYADRARPLPSPSTNGDFRHPPSANGDFRQPPSANGDFRHPPSANGDFRQPPSANSDFRQPPSANGNVRHPPSANGNVRHPPSANGVFDAPPSRNGPIANLPPSTNGDRLTNSRG